MLLLLLGTTERNAHMKSYFSSHELSKIATDFLIYSSLYPTTKMTAEMEQGDIGADKHRHDVVVSQ